MIRLLGNPSYTSPDGNISGDIDYLEGNLFGKVKFNATFEFSSFVGATDGNNVEIGNGDGSFPTYDYLTDTSGGFAEFRQGDLVDVTDFIETATGTTLLPTGAYLIDVKVDDNTVRLSKTNGDPLVVGVDIETGVADQGALRLDQEPEAASFSYGLIENDEGTNFISKVDGQELRHTIDSGAALPLALEEMEYKYKASAKIGSIKIRKVSEDLVNKIWRYEIEQVLFIHPFYLLSDLAANQEGVYPSIWAESACLRHVFRLRLYSTNSDSPRFQEVVYDGQEVQGNTGYEDENYNGIAATYTLASLDYTNSIGQATKDGTTVIQMSFDNITSNGRYVVLNFILLPEQDEDFKNINSPMQENYCFDRVVLDALGAPQDGEQFGTGFQVWQNCSASATASLVNVTAQINFGADVKAKIDGYASKRYKITANIYGDGEAFGSADETNVFVDFNEIGFEVPTGTIDVSTSILPHDINTVQDGFESPATVFANDEIVSNSLIFLDSDTFSDILLESVEAQLVASDGSTEAVLQSQLLDVSGQPVVGGARLVSEEFSQGLNVRNDELRAKVKLLRESASDSGTKYAYRLIYPFLFRWEYWEQLILDSLPSELFDAAERFNGYNHNWNRLGDLAGFQVYYRVIVRASVQGGSITSLTNDFELENNGYDSGVFTTREIKLFDGATELTYLGQPFIKDGIFTKIVSIWTSGVAVDAADYWAWMQIGKFENHTFKTIKSFSSVYDREGISYLSSNGGNGRITLANNGANTIEATCFIDPNEFPADADDYTIFARVNLLGLPISISFITNNEFSIDGSFDPSITTTTGADWVIDYGNGDVENYTGTQALNYEDYVSTGDKTVTITFNGSNEFLGIDLANDQIKGVLDLEKAAFLEGVFRVSDNGELTSIILPTNNKIFTSFRALNCDLTGTLNVSTLSGLGGNFNVSNNPNLTGILIPNTSQIFTVFATEGCNLLSLNVSTLSGLGGSVTITNVGTGDLNPNLSTVLLPTSSQLITLFDLSQTIITQLDLSGLTNLSGVLRVFFNPLLQDLTMPNISGLITNLDFRSCDIQPSLDLSGMNISTSLQVRDNNSLDSVSLPSTSNTFTLIRFDVCNLTNGIPSITNMTNFCNVNNHDGQYQSNGMIQSAVDQMLVDYDSIATGGFTGRSINIAGTNAAPSATGAAAAASLVTKGFTVTTN